MNKDEPFLARWSRLKRGEDKSQLPEVDGRDEPAAAPDPEAPAAEAAVDTEPLDLSKLPRLEDLTGQSDIRAFLDPRVPEGLRNEALRRAWRLDPVIDTFIEVAENQYDWNTPGGAPGFGPLVAGGDLPQLLAQATGRLFEKPEAPKATAIDAGTATATETVSFADGAAAAGQVADAAPREDTPAAVSLVTRSPAGPADLTDAAPSDEQPRQALARRHGSALPS